MAKKNSVSLPLLKTKYILLIVLILLGGRFLNTAIAIMFAHISVFAIRGVNDFFSSYPNNHNQKIIKEIKVTTEEMAKQIKMLNEKDGAQKSFVENKMIAGNNNNLINGNSNVINRNEIYIIMGGKLESFNG